jgi:hypothetical protein
MWLSPNHISHETNYFLETIGRCLFVCQRFEHLFHRYASITYREDPYTTYTRSDNGGVRFTNKALDKAQLKNKMDKMISYFSQQSMPSQQLQDLETLFSVMSHNLMVWIFLKQGWIFFIRKQEKIVRGLEF